jgi:hypothetical protein
MRADGDSGPERAGDFLLPFPARSILRGARAGDSAVVFARSDNGAKCHCARGAERETELWAHGGGDAGVVVESDFGDGNSCGYGFGQQFHPALLIPSCSNHFSKHGAAVSKRTRSGGRLPSAELRPLRFILPPFLNEFLEENFE